MKTIFKYRLAPAITMASGAQVLALQMQDGVPQIWALVDQYPASYESREFVVYRTGTTLPDNTGEYIGTYQDSFVRHVFSNKPLRISRPEDSTNE